MKARELRTCATQLRSALEGAFGEDTAFPGSTRHIPSAGHCAAVAALVKRNFGGWLVSATVENESHWFNRLRVGDQIFDIDLTGDQFGRAPIQIAGIGQLYPGTRVRRPTELLPETLARCEKLEQRARLTTSGKKHQVGRAFAATMVGIKK
jgi:hypothetical protein